MDGKERSVVFAAAQFAVSSKADAVHFFVLIARSNMFRPILDLTDSVQSRCILTIVTPTTVHRWAVVKIEDYSLKGVTRN
jgi:hypothetical protein